MFFKENHTVLGRKFPERIARIDEIATNLWWCWHNGSRELFRVLDRSLWRLSDHNPVKLLAEISDDKLEKAARDADFLTVYDAAIADFDREMPATNTWFANRQSDRLNGPVAFFSPEFALHSSLPIYAGGLGILAGDICKEANDIGLPLVGLGFMYPQGYFRQHISADGWQEETYHQITFDEAPISPCPHINGRPPEIEVPMADRTLRAKAWQVELGRIKLYLLDSNVEGNTPSDRLLSARLYTADREQRIQQEILLGIGGVRMLRTLGIEPSVWHANEGHTGFMMLERVREQVAKGIPFPEAVRNIQVNTVFTTHTPVPAGNDIFPDQLIDKYFWNYWGSLGIDRNTFIRLGSFDGSLQQGFNMTVLSLKMSDHRAAVSKIHGEVTRSMWHGIWPDRAEKDVPIVHVTNGIHAPTWIAPEMLALYKKYLGRDIFEKYDVQGLREAVMSIPDKDIWDIRQFLRQKLIHFVLERAQERWAKDKATADQIVAMGSLLDSATLTIGFVRRFAEYKRPALIFQDIERLKRIISDPWQPVQIIFAGKSHPADFPSKYLIHQVYELAKDRGFQGRIAFIEDYDMHVAHYLVQGVDVWLNNPRRRQEASGTSGMKAALNGVPHMSVRDGWWVEGYNGRNGWAIGDGVNITTAEQEDAVDAGSIYQLLENQVVPAFYDRDRQNIPHGWLNIAKEAIASIIPYFCTRRMLIEYVEQMYLPSVRMSSDKSSVGL
jgi:glycogen phosphorylase